jgi:hypothetical protein
MATIQASLSQLEKTLEGYFKKAPALPAGLKELIVKFAPWLILISLILLLPAILAALGLSALFLPASYLGGVGFGLNYTIAMIISIGTIILEVMALPGLFKRQLSAWRLVFYATLVSALASLIQLNLVGLIVGTAIGLYLLFQVKSYYH